MLGISEYLSPLRFGTRIMMLLEIEVAFHLSLKDPNWTNASPFVQTNTTVNHSRWYEQFVNHQLNGSGVVLPFVWDGLRGDDFEVHHGVDLGRESDDAANWFSGLTRLKIYAWDLLNNILNDYRLLSQYRIRIPTVVYLISRRVCSFLAAASLTHSPLYRICTLGFIVSTTVFQSELKVANAVL